MELYSEPKDGIRSVRWELLAQQIRVLASRFTSWLSGPQPLCWRISSFGLTTHRLLHLWWLITDFFKIPFHCSVKVVRIWNLHGSNAHNRKLRLACVQFEESSQQFYRLFGDNAGKWPLGKPESTTVSRSVTHLWLFNSRSGSFWSLALA